MRKVVLIFPDIPTLTEFVLIYKPTNVIINSSEKKISCTMTQEHLAIAKNEYRAKVIESSIVK